MAEPSTGTSIPVQLIVLPDIVKVEPDGADKRVSEVNPLGTVSSTLESIAASGPALLTSNVNIMVSPTFGDRLLTDFANDKSTAVSSSSRVIVAVSVISMPCVVLLMPVKLTRIV